MDQKGKLCFGKIKEIIRIECGRLPGIGNGKELSVYYDPALFDMSKRELRLIHFLLVRFSIRIFSILLYHWAMSHTLQTSYPTFQEV